MGLSVVTYALTKKYTDETASQFGGLKGAPCKVKSVIKTNGQSIITLEWKNDDGEIRTSEVYVNDGLCSWESGYNYSVGDVIIYNNTLYICKIANADSTFDPTKWQSISGETECDYYIINSESSLPSDLTINDKKIYFCIEKDCFYLWDGLAWEIINTGPNTRELTQVEYDNLTPEEKNNGTIYFVTDGEINIPAILTQNLIATKTVGGVTAGTEYVAGTPLEVILKDIIASS